MTESEEDCVPEFSLDSIPKENLDICRKFSQDETDLKYLCHILGAIPYNCNDPSKVLRHCETLSDYKFTDLFEEFEGKPTTDYLRFYSDGTCFPCRMDDYVSSNHQESKPFRTFKLKHDKIHDSAEDYVYINYLIELIWTCYDFYHESPEEMIIRFVPSTKIDGKMVLSLDGLSSMKYNSVSID